MQTPDYIEPRLLTIMADYVNVENRTYPMFMRCAPARTGRGPPGTPPRANPSDGVHTAAHCVRATSRTESHRTMPTVLHHTKVRTSHA